MPWIGKDGRPWKTQGEVRAARRAKGQCLYCTDPAMPDRASCERHLNYARQRTQRWLERRKEEKLS